MELTEENKATIDAKSYRELLHGWLFEPPGDPWFEGETGRYWGDRMKMLRADPGGQERHVQSSKHIGRGI
jgi:hypothetical protein